MKKIITLTMVLVLTISSFLGFKMNVYAEEGIVNHGKITYGASTVGHFTIGGQIAFCIEHEKTTPSTGTSFHDEIYNNLDIKKVLYYGWGGAEQWGGFENEAHGIVATSLTLSHYYAGTNVKTANRSFFDWLQTQPNAPDNGNVYLSKSNLESYVTEDKSSQRTEDITLTGDSRNVVTFPLPDGVALHNVSSGAVNGGNVAVRCGETFYLSAPTNLNITWNSGELKGSLPTYQPVLSIANNPALQTLGRLYVTDPVSSINLTVKWSALGYLELRKTDESTGAALSGAVYGIYQDSSCTQLMETLTTDGNGYARSSALPVGTYFVREITAPAGYVVKPDTYTYLVDAGQTALIGATDKQVTGSIHLVKKDNDTGNGLSGAVFGLYAANDISHPDGHTGILYRKDQMVTSFPATNSAGQTALSSLYLGNYYVKEITAPAGYVLNGTAYPVSLTYGGQHVPIVTGSSEIKNIRVTGSINLTKTDKETGKPQGDAVLKGAVYGLYAAATIPHPDGKTGVLYQKDQLVQRFPATGDHGQTALNNLYLGSYYVKEIAPSPGYLLDAAAYPVTLSYQGQNVSVVTKNQTVKEQVIKGSVQIVKHLQEEDINESQKPQKPEEGAEFQIIHKATGTVVKTMVTDKDGFAIATDLPYGLYTVHQTKGTEGYMLVKDFDVLVETEGTIYKYILENHVLSALLKVVKKDAETGETIARAGARFVILDKDGNAVEQTIYYPDKHKISEFETDASGTFMLPERLPFGTYTLVETKAPVGYLLAEPVPFTVSKDQIEPDDWNEDVVTVECLDKAVTGDIQIEKKGEVLQDYDGTFQYGEGGIPDCVFRITAEEDIFTPDVTVDADGYRNVLYTKGEVVEELTTNAQGKAISTRLPLGKYQIAEIQVPEGYVLNTEVQSVTLSYADDRTEVVHETVGITNQRQKAALAVEKLDAGTKLPLSGAEFTLYAETDIKNVSGAVIVAAGTRLETAVSDAEGMVRFTLDLPLGQYYAKETKAPEGYVSTETKLEFDAGYQGQDIPIIAIEKKCLNTPSTVEITKTDITGDTELAGATLTVLDKDGAVVDTWTSQKESPHVIKYLHPGESYTLREEYAPYGYLKAQDVTFTVKDTGEVQSIEMKDEVPTGTIVLNKDGEFLEEADQIQDKWYDFFFKFLKKSMEGVTFELYAAEDIVSPDGLDTVAYQKGELVETLITNARGIAGKENLPLGRYYLVETKTLPGFVLDKTPILADLSYQNQDTSVVYAGMNVTNERQKVKITIVKKDEETKTALEGAVFGLYAGEDIKHGEKEIIISKDTLLETCVTDKNGIGTFVTDLPLGQYYVKELTPPKGYVPTDKVFSVDASGKDDTTKVIEVQAEFLNSPIKVQISKTDSTGKTELPGAKLSIVDSTGKVVKTWVSTEKPYLIERLPAGEYILHEVMAPEGYALAEDMPFTVTSTGEIQKVHMKDELVTGKVMVKKADADSQKPLAGAEFELRNEAGEVLETLVTDETGTAVSQTYPIGIYQEGAWKQLTYTLTETKAPEGYLLDEAPRTIVFPWNNGTDAVVELVLDVPNKATEPKLPQTGEFPIGIVLTGIGFAGITTACALWYRNKKKNRKGRS